VAKSLTVLLKNPDYAQAILSTNKGKGVLREFADGERWPGNSLFSDLDK